MPTLLAAGAIARIEPATVPVQPQSSALRKELGIADLLLAQILLVIVPEFFGTAAKIGPSHVVLWLLAILLFFVPQAVVVSYLNRLMPLEGGLYEWARFAFGDQVGFVTAWNVWLTATIQVAQVALVATTYVIYATGPQAAWIGSNRGLLLGASIALIVLMMLVARLGLGVGKWASNTGSVFTLLIITTLAVLPLAHSSSRAMTAYHPLRLTMPALTLFSLSVFAKMTFGALSGFDTIAAFAGESRSPARNFARATFLSAPIIALLYILGTSSILAFVAPSDVDIIAPIPQALSQGLGNFGWASVIAPVAILLLLANYLCSYVTYFSSNARLPMVAGWDHLLPKWFTVLHKEHKTPVNSILFMGGVSIFASAGAALGVGNQEAFATLQIWTWTFYGIAYATMFAIPLLARKKLGIRPGLWHRIATGSGLMMTLLFVFLSIFPIIRVESQLTYTLKTVCVVLGANLFAVLLYRLGRRASEPVRPERPSSEVFPSC